MTTSVKTLGRLVDLYGEAGARDQFQHLITRLVQLEHPSASTIRVKRGDGGVDTFVGKYGKRLRVWQAKFFRGDLDDGRRQQIRDSFEAARLNKRFKVASWTLAIASDLSQYDQEWFDKWRDRQKVDIEVWPETEILRRVHQREAESVRVELFDEDVHVRLKAIYELLFDKRGAIAWDDLRPALLAELEEMHHFANDLSARAASPSIDAVDADWTTPVWVSFRDEIKERLRRRIWWAELVHVYELWDDLKRIVPRVSGGFGGREHAARSIGQMSASGPLATRLAAAIMNVRPKIVAEVDELPA